MLQLDLAFYFFIDGREFLRVYVNTRRVNSFEAGRDFDGLRQTANSQATHHKRNRISYRTGEYVTG